MGRSEIDLLNIFLLGLVVIVKYGAKRCVL